MSKIEYKVGDIVRIRDWEDMGEEFGYKGFHGDIAAKYTFTRPMRKFCGKTAEIIKMKPAAFEPDVIYTLKILERDANGDLPKRQAGYNFSTDMFTFVSGVQDPETKDYNIGEALSNTKEDILDIM